MKLAGPNWGKPLGSGNMASQREFRLVIERAYRHHDRILTCNIREIMSRELWLVTTPTIGIVHRSLLGRSRNPWDENRSSRILRKSSAMRTGQNLFCDEACSESMDVVVYIECYRTSRS